MKHRTNSIHEFQPKKGLWKSIDRQFQQKLANNKKRTSTITDFLTVIHNATDFDKSHTQSEIVSVMDINYSDAQSFISLMKEKKYLFKVMFGALKQIHLEIEKNVCILNQEMKGNMISLAKQMKAIEVNYQKQLQIRDAKIIQSDTTIRNLRIQKNQLIAKIVQQEKQLQESNGQIKYYVKNINSMMSQTTEKNKLLEESMKTMESRLSISIRKQTQSLYGMYEKLVQKNNNQQFDVLKTEETDSFEFSSRRSQKPVNGNLKKQNFHGMLMSNTTSPKSDARKKFFRKNGNQSNQNSMIRRDIHQIKEQESQLKQHVISKGSSVKQIRFVDEKKRMFASPPPLRNYPFSYRTSN